MSMSYRGIKHSHVSASKSTQPGSIKEVYRGIALFNRITKAR